MKKFLALALALVLVASFSIPVFAATTTVDVSTDSIAPLVKCKWETPDADPDTPGTQVEIAPGKLVNDVPTMVGTEVQYHAIVATDYLSTTYVYADVWHPLAQQRENINGAALSGWCGSYKYQVTLTYAGLPNVDDPTTGDIENNESDAFMDAYEAGLVTFNEAWWAEAAYDCNMDGEINEADMICDVIDEIIQGEAHLYSGISYIHNHQPAGVYKVSVSAETGGAWSDAVINYLTALETKSILLDFTSVDYGTVKKGEHVWAVSGDANMATDDKPTVWNNGNVYVNLYVSQDDAQFSNRLDTNGIDYVWNVHWDARLGSEVTAIGVAEYDPYDDPTLIPGLLVLCTPTKLDFSILVDKAIDTDGDGEIGPYVGTMTITPETVLYDSCGSY